MKIVSQNCPGLGNEPTMQGLMDLRKAEDPDILFLLKTKMLEREMDHF
jgi:hypothetical protein